MNPIILYDNRFEDGALSATDTAAGFDVNNIKDLRTHTYWKANAAGTLYITEAPLAADSVTLANIRLSLADGYAFVDFSTADVLTDYVGKRLVIIDSAGKKAVGYIKAEGTGETYLGNAGNELFITDLSGWTAYTGGGGSIVWNGASDVKFTQGGSSVWNHLNKALSTVIGATYHVKVVINSADTKACKVIVGSTDWANTSAYGGTTIYDSGLGGARTVEFEFVATTTTTYIFLADGQGSTKTSHWASCQVYRNFVSNGQFSSNTTGWTPSDCTINSVAGGYLGNCLEITRTGAVYQCAFQQISLSAGALYKLVEYVKSGTSGNETYTFDLYDTGWAASLFQINGTSSASWVGVSGYYCSSATANRYIVVNKVSATAGTMLFDEVSCKQVTAPSTTGVTIVSTPEGSTYNWESIESGFNYNDAAGYTYKISEAAACDTLGIMGHNLGTAGAAVSVESTDDESTWTERLAAFNPSDDTAILKTMTSFQAASKRLKIVTASVAPYLAVAMLGVRLEFNRGAYIGDGPIVPWQIGIVAEFNRSKTGNLLGNSIRYKPIDISITIPTDTYDWFNTYFWPFWRDHGSELKPFFFAPDLTTFTDKIFWMQLTEDSVLVPPMLVKDRVDGYTFIMRGVLEE